MGTFDHNVTMHIGIPNSPVQGCSVGRLRHVGAGQYRLQLLHTPYIRSPNITFDRRNRTGIRRRLRSHGGEDFPYNSRARAALGGRRLHFSNVPGLATKPKEINRQAAVIGYLSAFVMITVAGLGLLFAVNVRRRRSPLARA